MCHISLPKNWEELIDAINLSFNLYEVVVIVLDAVTYNEHTVCRVHNIQWHLQTSKNYSCYQSALLLQKIYDWLYNLCNISNKLYLIRSHLERNDLSNQYQSAYKKLYSTVTALLKVKNDIILNLNLEVSLHLLC